MISSMRASGSLEAARPLLRWSESVGGRACVRHTDVDVPPHANLYFFTVFDMMHSIPLLNAAHGRGRAAL